jgi:hypothetical protein
MQKKKKFEKCWIEYVEFAKNNICSMLHNYKTNEFFNELIVL